MQTKFQKEFQDIFSPGLVRIFFKKSYLFQLLKKPPNGRFRSEILRFIFFSTHIRSPGVKPGQYKSRFGPRSRTIFFFSNIVISFSCQNNCCSESSGVEFFGLYFFTHLSKKKSLPERSELQRHR